LRTTRGAERAIHINFELMFGKPNNQLVAGTPQISYVADMPKKKEPQLTPEEQIKRFKEAAKKAGVTDKEEEFERSFKRVALPPKKPKRV
jgi:hypothetical protein